MIIYSKAWPRRCPWSWPWKAPHADRTSLEPSWEKKGEPNHLLPRIFQSGRSPGGGYDGDDDDDSDKGDDIDIAKKDMTHTSAMKESQETARMSR